MDVRSYFVGDTPSGTLVLTADEGLPEDLAPFTTATVKLWDFQGDLVDDGPTAAIDGDTVEVSWPDTSPFETAGLYSLQVILSGANVRETMPALPVVVEYENSGWHTLESARRDWADAPIEDSQLFTLLYNARIQCEEFAPVLAEDERVPLTYRQAQLLQARNLWNASKVDAGSGGFGDDSFVIRPFPMDWVVKNILRPQRAIPFVG